MTLLIGALGAALLLIAFILGEFDVLDEKSVSYNLLNLLGAGFLTWYAVLLSSLPFIVLEGIWALVAAWYLFKRLADSTKNR